MENARALRSSMTAVVRWGAVVVLGTVVSYGTVPPVEAQRAPADLGGEWVLNVEQSDDPLQAMRRHRIASGGVGDGGFSGRGGGAVGGGAPGAAGGGPGGPGGPGGLGGGPAMGRGMSAGADELTIQILEGGVQITDSRGLALVLRTDREWYEVGERREIQAYWKKAKLVTRTRGRGEALVVQEYSLNKKGQLVVLNQIQFGGDGGTATYKRFYDRKESG